MRRRAEEGFAMVVAVVLVAVMAGLVLVVLQNGSHADHASGRGASWNDALHVAEAGVQDAIAQLQSSQGAVPQPFTGTVNEGSYQVGVTYLGRNRYQIDSRGTAGRGPGLSATRYLRVVLAPPHSFDFALFSLTDVNTKNNNHVVGDVWANGSVTVDQNDLVEGNVTAATGSVFLDNGSEVTKDVRSGGHDGSGQAIGVDTNATIGGSATASSTAPGCSDDPGHTSYWVNVVGSIQGSVTTWGWVGGGGSTGARHTGVCTDAPAARAIPPFTYSPANYPAPMSFSSPSDFDAWLDGGHQLDLSGTYYVEGGGAGDAIDLTGVTIGGDTTIITSAPIDANGVGAANDDDKLLVLVSTYQPAAGSACSGNGGNPADCAIGFKNNFQPTDNTATLLYAPNGPAAFKNNAEFRGAVYANDIVLKNNLQVIYDPRVDQIVGFGPVTLEPQSWVELPA